MSADRQDVEDCDAGGDRDGEARRLAVALQRAVLSALPAADREAFLAHLELLATACWQAAEIGRVAVARGGANRKPARPGRPRARTGPR